MNRPELRPALASLLFAAVALLGPAACGPAPAELEGRFFDGLGQDGQVLRLDESPARILPANLHAAELLDALVPRSRFAGLPGTAFEFGSGFGDGDDWEPPVGPGVLRRYRGEDVLALRPDLVLSGAYQDLETTALLRRSGVPVLGFRTVRSLEDVEQGLELLGRAVGAEDRAADVLEGLRARRAELAERVAPWAGRSGLVYTNYGTGAWTQGAESPGQILVELAGLRNAAAEGDLAGHYQIDVERLLVLDPDVIVCGAPVAELGVSAQVLREDPRLQTLAAVRQGRVVTLPAALYQTTSHRLLDAAEALADRLESLGLTARD